LRRSLESALEPKRRHGVSFQPSLTDSWPSRHFSISNPRANDVTDLPALLRRAAAEIERQQIKADEVLVVTIDQEITEDGPWWSATVVWAPQASEPT
jgi:hypothetical protein